MTAVNGASPTMNGESLWPRLAGLPLVIEACEYNRLHAVLAQHRDVLAQPVRAGADEAHVRRDALELVGEDAVQAFVLARLDDER
jgi:hypothetical protein